MNAKLNKRERKAQRLLAHYATCERLGRAVGMESPDGKKISTLLFNLESICHAAALAFCNGERVQGRVFMKMPLELDFTSGAKRSTDETWNDLKTAAKNQIYYIFGADLPGFSVNADARGYALKINNETPEGKALIEKARLHTDWGGYGILSPEINGDA